MRTRTFMAIAASSLLLLAIISPVAYAKPDLELKKSDLELKLSGPKMITQNGQGTKLVPFKFNAKAGPDQVLFLLSVSILFDGKTIFEFDKNCNLISVADPGLSAMCKINKVFVSPDLANGKVGRISIISFWDANNMSLGQHNIKACLSTNEGLNCTEHSIVVKTNAKEEHQH